MCNRNSGRNGPRLLLQKTNYQITDLSRMLLIPLTASADDASAFSDELLHLTDAQAADRCLRHESSAADMYPCVVVMFSSGFACYKVQKVAFVRHIFAWCHFKHVCSWQKLLNFECCEPTYTYFYPIVSKLTGPGEIGHIGGYTSRGGRTLLGLGSLLTGAKVWRIGVNQITRISLVTAAPV